MNFKEFKWLRSGSSSWLPENNKEFYDTLKGREILDWVRDTEMELCFTELTFSKTS
jgi:hypothetical protein